MWSLDAGLFLGAQSFLIKTRHAEEDGDEYGILEDERGADDGFFQRKAPLARAHLCSLRLPPSPRPEGTSLGQSRLVRPKDGRMPRERSRARPGNSGLSTVRHACASECFFRKKGSTVCETLLNMRELISWSFVGGQSFCCFHADLFVFHKQHALCRQTQTQNWQTPHNVGVAPYEMAATTPKVSVPYFAAQPRNLEDTKKTKSRGKNSWILYMRLTTVERHTIVALIGTATSAAQNQDTTSVQCRLGSSRLLFRM